jgi:hypothetical protein
MKKSFIALIGIMLVSAGVNAEEITHSSNQNMLDEARESVAHVENVIAAGQAMLSQAQADADVPRMDCLNAQLVNAKGFLNVVQNGEANLRDAIARNDVASQQHHFKLVQLAVSRSNDIETRMTECTSDVQATFTGETKLEVTRSCDIEPCIDAEEYYSPSINAVDVIVEISQTVDASPYL